MTTANATDVQNRLKAALACLDLTLENELTQYRYHRMVTGTSPFDREEQPQSTPSPEDDFPEFAELAAMTEAAAARPQTSFAITPVVPTPEPVAQTPPESMTLSEATSSLVPESTMNGQEGDTHDFEVDDFSFDASELAGLLPQAFAQGQETGATDAGSTSSSEVSPGSTVKRPMASTRALLKNVQGGDRPVLGFSITPLQRWLMVVGVLGGFAAALGVYMLLRGDRLPEQPEAPASEVSQPQANSPSTNSGAASRSNNAVPGGPDLTAREFAEVNPKTLSQLQPTPAATLSETPTSKPENSEESSRGSQTRLDMSILQMPNGHYYIFAPYNKPEDLDRAQEFVPEAFLIRLADGLKIQLAVFEDEPSAKNWVSQMR